MSALESLGISLSGGGQRAALFGLGALIGLVDSGANQKTRAIASVSGGSWTNAFVGTNTEFDSAAPEQFWQTCEEYAYGIANREQMEWAFWTQVIGSVILMLVGITLAVIAPLWGIEGASEWIGIPILGLTLGVAPSALGFKSWRHREHGRKLVANARTNRKTVPVSALYDGIEHVVCATDLESGDSERGRHVFFTSNSISSPSYGNGRTDKVSLGDAVAASAAFPLFFLPIRLKAEEIDFDRPPPHGRILLADGGIHDNLGLSWFHWKEGGVREGIKWTLVVNSTWAPIHQRLRWFATIRVAKLMHQSNVAARVAAAKREYFQGSDHGNTCGAVVSIGDDVHDVITTAERLQRDTASDATVGVPTSPRLKQAREFLETVKWHRDQEWPLASDLGEPTNWTRLAESAATVKTTIFRVRRDDAKRVLFHGYVLTMLNLLLFGGVQPPPRPRTLDDFDELVSTAPKSKSQG